MEDETQSLGDLSLLMDSLPMDAEVVDGSAINMVPIKKNPSKCRGSLGLPSDTSLDSMDPAGPAVPATIAVDLDWILVGHK